MSRIKQVNQVQGPVYSRTLEEYLDCALSPLLNNSALIDHFLMTSLLHNILFIFHKAISALESTLDQFPHPTYLIMRFTAILAFAMASVAMAQDGTHWLSKTDCEERGDGYVCIIMR